MIKIKKNINYIFFFLLVTKFAELLCESDFTLEAVL